MSVLIFFVILYILLGVTLMKPFEKAGVPGWKALVPGLRGIEWCKIVGRKPTYALWLLFPIVNIFIYAGLCIDLVRSFGKYSLGQAALAVIYAPIPFFMIGRNANDKYQGPVLEKERAFHRQYAEAQEKKDLGLVRKLEATNPFKKSAIREWVEAIIFAVFAAAFIRMFLIEAYVIPTSSMEGSLKVGDFLFVSKAHYGIRTPMTVVQFPLVHNRFSNNPGLLGRESYTRNPALPYYRLPAIEKIDRNEPVVFNYPAGDSVIVTPQRNFDLYQWRREGYAKRFPNMPIVARPVDKKDHYIKRCVGVPGDSLMVRGAQLYINGQPGQNPEHLQYSYKVTGQVNLRKLEDWGINPTDAGEDAPSAGVYNLDAAQVEQVKSLGVKVERIAQELRYPGYVFPYDLKNTGNWTTDEYGPIYIPKAGVTTPLNMQNIAFYERIIRDFEGNTLKIADDKIYVNGTETTSYTFKQDYYWMMGDNRHNSEDSRIWGYVPADHVVGKPLFIWFSTRNGKIRDGINWNRIFRSANRM